MKLVRMAILALAACALQGCADEERALVSENDAARIESDETSPAGLRAADLRQTQQDKIEAAVASEHRPAEARARDRYRHPVQTLDFFDIEADMMVIELWPGSGWYTEILAPLLQENGQLIVASFGAEAEPEYRAKIHEEFLAKLEGDPDLYGKLEVVTLDPPAETRLGEPGSADMVLTFRNTHNWINDDVEHEVYQAVYEVLRPGGIFGVVQHRGKKNWKAQESAKRGYVPERHVIQLAESVGFQLTESSEINANPADTKDYPEGVWTLPPSYRLGDEDRERYAEIGESDRMTLQFRKPLN